MRVPLVSIHHPINRIYPVEFIHPSIFYPFICCSRLSFICFSPPNALLTWFRYILRRAKGRVTLVDRSTLLECPACNWISGLTDLPSMSLLMYIFRIGSLDINTRYVIITIYFLLTAWQIIPARGILWFVENVKSNNVRMYADDAWNDKFSIHIKDPNSSLSVFLLFLSSIGFFNLNGNDS